MSSKNNPNARRGSQKGKIYDGKPVKPVKFIGSLAGKGNIIAAQYDNGQLVTDEAGDPIPWDNI